MPRTTTPCLDVAAVAATDQPDLDVPHVGVRLRPWRVDDAPAVRAVYADPAVQRWHVRTVDTDDEAVALVTGWAAGWRTSGHAEWAVVTGDGLLGRVAVKVVHADGVGEIAYWTAPAARGRGIAPAAVRAASTWAAGVGYQRLQLEHSVDNTSSCRVAAKAGYDAEGTRRHAVLHDDGWHDMHEHVLLP